MSYERVATCTKKYLSSDGADVDLGDEAQVVWAGDADAFEEQEQAALRRLWQHFQARVQRAEQAAQAFRDGCK
ncbi:MAG: hypothetical protein KGN00_02530 [Chloroflexota bacterium]|nr:hypothetical protein [Chloroflexota bacterium]MDE3192541.1 hypothetical protein [Chloroflexota bacterium]